MDAALISFYNRVDFIVANSPKLFSYYANQSNRTILRAAVQYAADMFECGLPAAPAGASFLTVVRMFVKKMNGLKPAAGVKDWKSRPASREYAVETLTILLERFDVYIDAGEPVGLEIIRAWRDHAEMALGAKKVGN
jgi:hypothetical protein